jgi:hypothetical protein
LAERGHAPRHVRRVRNAPCCSQRIEALAGRELGSFNPSSARDLRYGCECGHRPRRSRTDRRSRRGREPSAQRRRQREWDKTAIEPGDEGDGGSSEGATVAQKFGAETEGDGVRDLRIRPPAAAGARPTRATPSGRASRSPSALTRTTRSTLSPKRFATTTHVLRRSSQRGTRKRSERPLRYRLVRFYNRERARSDCPLAAISRSRRLAFPYATNCETSLGMCPTGSSHSPGYTNSPRRTTISSAVDISARRVSDPALLQAFVNASADLRRIGWEAFQRQQEQ